MKKLEAMKEMEKAGLGFTANVIMTGCGKPAKKMNTIVELLKAGVSVNQAPHETCGIVIEGKFFWLSILDEGFDSVIATLAVMAQKEMAS